MTNYIQKYKVKKRYISSEYDYKIQFHVNKFSFLQHITFYKIQSLYYNVISLILIILTYINEYRYK